MNYLLQGLKVLTNPGYRRFIFIPLLANLVFFVLLTTFMFGIFGDTVLWVTDWLPSWMNFMGWFIWFVLGSVFFIVYGVSFSIITNIFAAPFNGLLAEKIQRDMGLDLPDGESLSSLITRTLGRELSKLVYFIWYGLWVTLGLVLLSWVPLLNVLVPILAFMWGAWCLSIQYLDYAADNNQQTFKDLRADARKSLFGSLSFGGIIAFLMMVPVVNIFVMPVAVAGGTYMWLGEIYQGEATAVGVKGR
jgi:CysZ protein